MSVPTPVNTLIRQSLIDTVNILYPLSPQFQSLVKQHNWYTPNYVGMHDGKPVGWKGWSVNLNDVDMQFRTLYVDFVPNLLPVQSRLTLFGNDFAQTIDQLDSFVVMFNTGYPLQSIDLIKASGFTPRALPNVLHATKVIDAAVFRTMPSLYWASYLIKLLRLKWHTTLSTSDNSTDVLCDDDTYDIWK